MAARIKAEEQALIEGLKAVPRAERHRLREIPEEEAYDQWRLRLAAEAIENAAEQTEEIWQQILEKNGKREEWELEHWDQWLNEIADKNEDAACGEKQEKQAEEELSAFTEQYENAQSAWTDACLFWYDIWCEAHPEPVMDPGTSDTDDLFRKIQSRPKRTAPKYKFDLLRVHQPPQFCDLTAATGPVNFDISGTGQSLQAGADIGFRKLDPFFFQPAAQERTSAAGIGSNKGQDPVFRYI